MALINRFTLDVLESLKAFASEVLRGSFLDGAPVSDLRILANARCCEKCGFIYEAGDYAAGCPNCAAMSAAADAADTARAELEEAEGERDDAYTELESVRAAARKQGETLFGEIVGMESMGRAPDFEKLGNIAKELKGI